MGDNIHSVKALLRLVSCGLISVFIILKSYVSGSNGTRTRHQFFGSAFKKNLSTILSALWTEVDYPVGKSDDVEIMLNDYNCIACINEFADNLIETINIVHVQSCGRLIHDIDVSLFAQFGRNLQSLVLATRQRA